MADAVPSYVDFLGLKFAGLRFQDVRPEVGVLKVVVTVNADLVLISRSSSRFGEIVNRSISTFDGQVTYWLARLMSRPRGVAFEKISGSTLSVELLDMAKQRGMRVFLLGADPQSNKTALSKMRARGVDIEGYSPPFSTYPFTAEWIVDVQTKIENARPQIVLVGFGSPKQEYWLDDSRDFLRQTGVQVAVGCGGAIDFLSGAVPRAPNWVQKIGMEGLFRLAVQPRWFRVKRLCRSLLIIPIAIFHNSASQK